jgi:hypothetical protein
LNEVMLILPPVQFGNSRYRLFVHIRMRTRIL